jgi:hypothetical protein
VDIDYAPACPRRERKSILSAIVSGGSFERGQHASKLLPKIGVERSQVQEICDSMRRPTLSV